tara:strand:- start:522 stop:1751 length:1230 start_codon:yes stop_codon:yes gene_type:complete
MTKICSFKAIRPVRDKVQLVATKPYYSYKKNILKAKLESNPFTFLHIINPEFGSPQKTKPNSKERFELVKKGYEEFLTKSILIQEDEPKIYYYKQTKGGHEFGGVIAGANVEEYDNGLIKKHEATITSRENIFIDYLDIVGYNAEPVLLTHEPNPSLDKLLIEITKKRPEYEYSTTDQIKHELWVINEKENKLIKEEFEKISSVYIADGHHRCASSSGLYKKKKNLTTFKNEDYFLAFFMDERQIKILEFNRLVNTLNGMTKDTFIEKIKEIGLVEEMKQGRKPNQEHEFTFYFKKSWFSLKLNLELIPKNDPVNSLDTALLTNLILTPLLEIKDLKTDERISFVSGEEDMSKIISKVDKDENNIAFLLFPITMDQIKKVADQNQIMPPKSTWVEPKLRSGLTIYPIKE